MGALEICWGRGPFLPPSGLVHQRGIQRQGRSGATSLYEVTVHLSVSDDQQVILLLFRLFKGLHISRFGVQSVLCTYIFIFSLQPLSGFDL